MASSLLDVSASQEATSSKPSLAFWESSVNPNEKKEEPSKAALPESGSELEEIAENQIRTESSNPQKKLTDYTKKFLQNQKQREKDLDEKGSQTDSELEENTVYTQKVRSDSSSSSESEEEAEVPKCEYYRPVKFRSAHKMLRKKDSRTYWKKEKEVSSAVKGQEDADKNWMNPSKELPLSDRLTASKENQEEKGHKHPTEEDVIQDIFGRDDSDFEQDEMSLQPKEPSNTKGNCHGNQGDRAKSDADDRDDVIQEIFGSDDDSDCEPPEVPVSDRLDPPMPDRGGPGRKSEDERTRKSSIVSEIFGSDDDEDDFEQPPPPPPEIKRGPKETKVHHVLTNKTKETKTKPPPTVGQKKVDDKTSVINEIFGSDESDCEPCPASRTVEKVERSKSSSRKSGTPISGTSAALSKEEKRNALEGIPDTDSSLKVKYFLAHSR